MSYDNGSELELDGEQTTDESQVIDDSNNDDTGEDTTPEQKNKSNFKKLSEAKKAAEYALKAERQEKEALREELERVKEVINSFYGEDQEKPFTSKEQSINEDKASKLEQKIFLIENKEAKEYMDEITEAVNKYNMDLDDAWTFVKAKLPKESVTKLDFKLSNKAPAVKKDLKDIWAEEALKLSKEDQAKWRKLHLGI